MEKIKQVVWADGIKTVVHTSRLQLQGELKLKRLLQAGAMSAQEAELLAKGWADDELRAHAKEHQRVREMVRFLREECAAPVSAAMYLEAHSS